MEYYKSDIFRYDSDTVRFDSISIDHSQVYMSIAGEPMNGCPNTYQNYFQLITKPNN